MRKIRIIFIILLAFCFKNSFAQQPSHFFLGEEVFSGVQIYDVIQDNENNYWFATDQGFFKYDNYKFKRVSCKNMKGTSAFGFVKDRNGIIYCFNLNKQIIKIENSAITIFYELNNNDFTNDIQLLISSNDELLIFAKKVIYLDAFGKKKNLPLSSLNYFGNAYKLSNGKIVANLMDKDSLLIIDGNHFEIKPINTNGTPVNGVLKFFESNNYIYAISSTDKQFYIYKSVTGELIPFIKFDALDTKEFFRFYDVDGSLWIAGTLSGVYNGFQDPNNFNLKGKYFKDYLISDVYKDNEGNLLFSTFNHGVMVVPFLGIPDVLPFPEIESPVSIAIDETNGLLIGTLKGELWNVNPNGRQIINENGTRPVQAVFTFHDFPYYIFDDGRIKARHKLTGKTYELANSSLKDAVLHNGNIYLALNSSIGKVYLDGEFPRYEKFIDDNIRTYAIDIDDSGVLYVATSEGLINFKTNKESHTIEFKGKTVFANDLYSFNNYIYVATNNDGILKIKNGKVVGQIQPKWANKSTEILKITVYGSEYCLLTSTGFYYVNFEGEIISQLNKMHGFSTRRIYDFKIIGEGDYRDKLWLVHSNGVHQFNINILEGTKVDTPSIQMKNLLVNNEFISFNEKQNFKYDSRDFRFQFSSPSLKNKENIRYHYILEGYDKKWHVKNYYSNEVSYNALAPGEYTFRVKAENQGKFSDEKKYSFVVMGPFYYSWWFLFLITGGGVGVVVLFYRRKLKNQKKKAQIINEINSSRLAAIQSQMNPHFIFNSLNAIQDLVLKGDIDNSYAFITKFSDLVRRTLDYSSKDFIEFDQEIKLINLYLSLEKLRFKEQLQIELETNDIDDILIPPMLIQPFIENAILHGLLHKDGEKKISIRFELNNSLKCIIEDNGIGRKKSDEIKARQRVEHESFSGKAIKRRFEILKQQFGEDLGFSYEDLENNGKSKGTRVILTLPIKHKF